MLYMIGLGLNDEKDLTFRGLHAAKKCVCFIDTYTNKWHGDMMAFKELVGKNVIELKRSDMEENVQTLLNHAKDKNIAVFVPGDPLAATTHANIILEAKKQGIKYEIIHNASIYSALGELGLQMYKYGKSATVPFTGHIQACKNAIVANRSIGLHTMLLMDVDRVNNKFMEPKEALKMLIDSKGILKNYNVIVASRLGSEKPKICYNEAQTFLDRDFEAPCIIVIPYNENLHSEETEFLKSLEP